MTVTIYCVFNNVARGGVAEHSRSIIVFQVLKWEASRPID